MKIQVVSETYLAHLVVVFNQRIDGFDRQEAVFVHADDWTLVFEDVRRDDGRQVVRVHLAATFFIHL